MRIVSSCELIRSSRVQLGLAGVESTIDLNLLAALVRRAATFLCPCARAELSGAMCESLAGLVQPDQLTADVSEAVERLLLVGDLLELSGGAAASADASESWVFAAPPSFVPLDSVTLILGIEGEDGTLLPQALRDRVIHVNGLRTIPTEADEDLSELLEGVGLVGISAESWVRPPPSRTAAEVLAMAEAELRNRPPSGSVPGLTVLDAGKPVGNYRSRWSNGAGLSGRFVCRRPQMYGADLWGFCELDKGNVARFVDFPLRGSRFRGCDAAWRLQCAIDSTRGEPQTYRLVVLTDEATRFDFNSPLPSWVERRFVALGSRCKGQGLVVFVVPNHAASELQGFVERAIWLRRSD